MIFQRNHQQALKFRAHIHAQFKDNKVRLVETTGDNVLSCSRRLFLTCLEVGRPTLMRWPTRSPSAPSGRGDCPSEGSHHAAWAK